MRYFWQGMLISLVISAVFQIIALSMLLTGEDNTLYMKLMGCGGSLIYGFYVIIDLKLISDKIEIDDYILGALTLYIDLITLFVHLLQIFGKRK